MTINYKGRKYSFRECDTNGMTVEQLEELANKTGKMQYEPGAAWLVVPKVGYGWEYAEGIVEIY